MRVMSAFLITVVALSASWMFAEDEGEKGNGKERGRSVIDTNNVYNANCGSCHFAYPLRLLPAAAWADMLDKPGKHAGGDLDLKDKARADVKKYIAEHSADRRSSKKSDKAVSTAGDGPIRISDVPRVKEKHKKIAQEVFARKSIGSRGNCIACHKNAARGDFDEDGVSIPGK
jgi:hypothetical protein